MRARDVAGPLTLAGMLTVVSSFSLYGLGAERAVAAYALGAAAVLVAGLPAGAALLRRAPRGVLPLLVVAVTAALVVLYVVGIPDDLRVPLGAGSDRADALDVALARLADGLYPYAATTFVGNPISPLPGAFVLAAPFWWLTGTSAWQNLAWLVLLLAAMHGTARAPSSRGLRARPTLLWALVVLGGLELVREWLVGDDLVWGVVPALAAVVWTLRAAERPRAVLVGAAVVLGVTTCTRPHLVLLLVIVAAAVAVRAGRRRALLVGGVAAATWAVLVVPFLLGGVARFSPLHVAAKVTGDRSVTLGIVVIALAALAVLVGTLALVRPAGPVGVGWCAAAVLFAPSVLSAARALVVGWPGEVDLTLGAAAVPFALWAVAAQEPAEPDGGRAAGDGLAGLDARATPGSLSSGA